VAAVLIVDDDQDTRTVINLALSDEGHTTYEASGGEGTLEALRGATTRYIVMVDEHMPGMSGAQLLRQISVDPVLRAQHIFILMTADPQAATAMQNDDELRVLISAIMLKPFDLDDLLNLIHTLDTDNGTGGRDADKSNGSGGSGPSPVRAPIR
jgi:CheY-like chemotaxis protein